MPISKDPEKRKRQLANLQNRKQFAPNDERTRNAGEKSGKVRREKKTQREYYEMLDSRIITDAKGKPLKDKEGNVLTGAYKRSAKVYKMAQEGNLEAAKYIDKMLGQAPKEQVDVNVSGSPVKQDFNFFNIEDYEETDD